MSEEIMSFKAGMLVDTTKYVAKKAGLSYLPWAAAYASAGRPEFSIPAFGGVPYRRMLGGGCVAVDMGTQRMWLPILDAANKPVPESSIDGRDVVDAHSRCLTKAIAATCGVGLSVYAGYEGAGQRLGALLPINEGDSLEEVQAVVEKKNQAAFVPWWAGLAACKLADPEFRWEVVEFPIEDSCDTVPFLKSASGVMVAVEVFYRGRAHRQWLPVMDFRFNAKAEASVSVMDWNTTVMRALAKGIAVVSGYGLAVYAGEDTTPAAAATPESTEPATPNAAAAAQGSSIPAAQMKTVATVITKLEGGANPEEVRRWLTTAAAERLCGAARQLIEDKLATLHVASATAEEVGASAV